MTGKEAKLAGKMLNELSDILGNRVCNDWEFPEDWTDKEKQTFLKGYHDYNGDPEEYDCTEEPRISDFMVADYLAHKLSL